MMKFSFIVPVYDCKDYLLACVDSIRAVNAEDYEILLIDDGSTDGSGAICDDLAEKYPEIRVVHQSNAGASAARNRGIQASQGDYILFLDADDAVYSDRLHNASRVVQREKPDMLIFGMSFDYYFHDRLYRRDELIYPVKGTLTKQQWTKAFEELYWCNALSPVWNKFIRREILEHNNIRFADDLIEMEDFVFSIECLKYCNEVRLLSEVIYQYRQPEKEKNTYYRLCSIDSLSVYMEPFEKCIDSLIQETEMDVAEALNVRRIVDMIYLNFFHERIRFASPKTIRMVAQDMLRSSYAEVVERENPELFRRLQSGSWHSVWMYNAFSRARHWSAVRVKYLRSLGRKK